MAEHFWLGIAIILLGGALNGSFPLPMKYVRRWRWENTWMVFSLVALLILPWTLAGGFAPELGQVYRGVPGRVLFYPLAFGLLWGVSQTTFGLGLKALGMAFAFAVVAGLAALFGSLVPLLVLSPSDLFRPRGILLLVSIPILLLGLALYARAGRRRDQEQHASDISGGPPARSFMAGLAICIFTGVVGPSFNLGFAFSGEIIRRSIDLGANQVTSTYPVWALVLTAGLIPNLLYCVFLLFRNRGWHVFGTAGWGKEAVLGIAMALLWLSGIVVYGIGATQVGTYGTSVGFALFVSAQILTSTTIGIVAGEWKDVAPETRRLLAAGVVVIIISVVVLSLGGLF